MKTKYVYRVTDQDYNNQWVNNHKDALKVQKAMYNDGAERVSIAKEYMGG